MRSSLSTACVGALGSTMLALVLTSPSSTAAWLNPEVSVKLDHPPGLGLKIERIAFGPHAGQCSDQVVDGMIADFVSNGVEVIDRNHLNAILDEHDLSFSGYVDQTTAARMGQILGPTALVFVKSLRCETKVDRSHERVEFSSKERGTYYKTKYTTKTTAFLNVSVQTVDLTTGRVFAAKTFQFSPEQANASWDGYPEAPSTYDMTDLAVNLAVISAHRLFLPWSEYRDLVYFNNDKCGLKEAYRLLKAGDKEGSLELSEKNLADCLADPKMKDAIKARAHYNVGMGHMILGDEDRAMEFFQEAMRLDSAKAFSEAMADCRRSKELKLAMLEIEERATIAAEERMSQEEARQQQEAASTLTNDDVVTMVKGGLPDPIVIAKIKNSRCAFETSAEQLTALHKAGVGADVITAMMESAAAQGGR